MPSDVSVLPTFGWSEYVDLEQKVAPNDTRPIGDFGRSPQTRFWNSNYWISNGRPLRRYASFTRRKGTLQKLVWKSSVRYPSHIKQTLRPGNCTGLFSQLKWLFHNPFGGAKLRQSVPVYGPKYEASSSQAGRPSRSHLPVEVSPSAEHVTRTSNIECASQEKRRNKH